MTTFVVDDKNREVLCELHSRGNVAGTHYAKVVILRKHNGPPLASCDSYKDHKFISPSEIEKVVPIAEYLKEHGDEIELRTWNEVASARSGERFLK